MKKILTLVCALVLGAGFASAQVHQGETAAGVNLVYGSEIESAGIGARFQYGVTDQLRAEVGLNYFFEKNHLSWWDVNINAHYLVGLWNEHRYPSSRSHCHTPGLHRQRSLPGAPGPERSPCPASSRILKSKSFSSLFT